MTTIRELKEAIEKMNALYAESEKLEDTNETASDKAYNAAYELSEEIIDAIMKATHGLIERKIARIMVLGQTDKLLAICNRFMK